MRTTRILFAAALAVSAAAATGCVVSDDTDPSDATFTISNRSSYFLDEIRLAPIDSRSWGADLVDTLAPGEDLIITDIRCGTYDVLVVDDTGVECELHSVDMCANDDRWVIDDVTLDVCAFNPARGAEPVDSTNTALR
jgi:hypothetical protein